MESGPAARVRAAREDDLELLPVIQIAAGAAFREIGMAAIADAAPLPAPALAAYQQAGRAWVAVAGEDLPPDLSWWTSSSAAGLPRGALTR
jgi:hypothetical protein